MSFAILAFAVAAGLFVLTVVLRSHVPAHAEGGRRYQAD